MNELMIERMTWPEIDTCLNNGYDTIVIACGATEQHGPHLPLFVDSEHGTQLANGIARKLGNALVAPTIRVGCSEEHMGFPGTITLQPGTFKAICEDYCTSLAQHGFKKIYLVPSHGGNFKPLADILEYLQEAVGSKVKVSAFTDMTAVVNLWKDIVDEEGGSGSNVGGHADIAESSIMLALYPKLVKRKAATPGYMKPLTPPIVERITEKGIHSVISNGILGNPEGMSETIGRRCIEAFVDMAVLHLRNS